MTEIFKIGFLQSQRQNSELYRKIHRKHRNLPMTGKLRFNRATNEKRKILFFFSRFLPSTNLVNKKQKVQKKKSHFLSFNCSSIQNQRRNTIRNKERGRQFSPLPTTVFTAARRPLRFVELSPPYHIPLRMGSGRPGLVRVQGSSPNRLIAPDGILNYHQAQDSYAVG